VPDARTRSTQERDAGLRELFLERRDRAAVRPDPRSGEGRSSQRISGNLICHNNIPTAQINVGDGGAANIVGGNSIGECPSRVGNNNP
jgi:hypothetical protein